MPMYFDYIRLCIEFDNINQMTSLIRITINCCFHLNINKYNSIQGCLIKTNHTISKIIPNEINQRYLIYMFEFSLIYNNIFIRLG